MPEEFNPLKAKLDAELEVQRKRQAHSSTNLAKKFGLFIQASMTNLGKSRADFEIALKLDSELAEAILDGVLPEQELDEGLIEEIAAFLEHDSRTLLLVLERKVDTSAESPNSFSGNP